MPDRAIIALDVSILLRLSVLNGDIFFLCPLRPITVKLCLDCCRDQLLGSRSQQICHLVSTRKINNFSRFHGGVFLSVGLLSHNNNSTRYAANLQTAQTPDSVIAPIKKSTLRRHLGADPDNYFK